MEYRKIKRRFPLLAYAAVSAHVSAPPLPPRLARRRGRPPPRRSAPATPACGWRQRGTSPNEGIKRSIRSALIGGLLGVDHGVGHSLLLLMSGPPLSLQAE